MTMITFSVSDTAGELRHIEVPEDISLSMMEVLKASDYPIAATCGGMALCATCHISVEKGADQFPPPSDAELDMIDTLPDAGNNSRLACQVRIGPFLNGAHITLKESSDL